MLLSAKTQRNEAIYDFFFEQLISEVKYEINNSLITKSLWNRKNTFPLLIKAFKSYFYDIISFITNIKNYYNKLYTDDKTK